MSPIAYGGIPLETVSAGRRSFLRGLPVEHRLPKRPPWALVESAFLERCTRCSECVSACPAGILVALEGGYPEVDFRHGECTFCGDCEVACKPRALTRKPDASPWSLKVSISAGCLASQGVECRVCAESCATAAIRFRPRMGGVALPQIDLAACNGCGACEGICPGSVIRVMAEEVPNFSEIGA